MVIPFGGGSSISGSLQAEPGETRPVISIDMGRLNRVLWVDATSQLACVQAGVFGPDLERQLNAQGWTLRPLSRQLRALDAGRLDRHALLGYAVRSLRRCRRAHARAAGGHPVGHARRATGAEHVNRPERARDGAGQRGSAGGDHRGDDPRPPRAARAPDPRLFVPHLGGRPGRHARHRRQRGLAVGDACVRRPRERVLVRHRATPRRRSTASSRKALQAFLRRKGWDLEAMCLSFIGYEGSANHVAAQRKLSRADRQAPRRAVHRPEPGRAVRPEEVRHALHSRLPARPRGSGRRLGDLGAVERAADGLRQRDGGRSRRLRRSLAYPVI